MNDMITAAEALRAMVSFLDAYWERGHPEDSHELADLLSSLSILEDGYCADPALSEEWHQIVQRIIGERAQIKSALSKP
jgi:hypothetical protein